MLKEQKKYVRTWKNIVEVRSKKVSNISERWKRVINKENVETSIIQRTKGIA